jgi:hypothetical protein
MKVFKNTDVENYLQQDWIMKLLQENSQDEDIKVITNEWLMSDINKRMIYAEVYGDILMGKQHKKVLDTGGGINTLTKILASKCEYTLVDLLAHGGKRYVDEKGFPINLKVMDWYMLQVEDNYDVVIANDIFPNVDQRMELFIEKMLPHCKELRLVLTYYNTPRFYTTQRLDGEEIMTMLGYDGEIVALKLKKYLHRIIDTEEKELLAMHTDMSSIYRNGRQVAYIKMRGLIE